jgi:[ribosomal protein S5]-alanine N-acetyltransferase
VDLVSAARIGFVRLTDLRLAAVLALLNEPRNARHMPLSKEFTEESAAEWVAAKDGQWNVNGYEPRTRAITAALGTWG